MRLKYITHTCCILLWHELIEGRFPKDGDFGVNYISYGLMYSNLRVGNLEDRWFCRTACVLLSQRY